METRAAQKQRRGPWWVTANSRGMAIAFTVIYSLQAAFWILYSLNPFSAVRLVLGVAFALLAAAGLATVVHLTRHPPHLMNTPASDLAGASDATDGEAPPTD